MCDQQGGVLQRGQVLVKEGLLGRNESQGREGEREREREKGSASNSSWFALCRENLKYSFGAKAGRAMAPGA